ncbi:MAG: hypothetical protein J7J06_00370 [Methanosarcinales archaeon]|nr:hypothetical protein [Methanosarcinales archaeon]
MGGLPPPMLRSHFNLAAGGFASCDPATLDDADVNGDGRVTSLDVLRILQAAANSIEL